MEAYPVPPTAPRMRALRARSARRRAAATLTLGLLGAPFAAAAPQGAFDPPEAPDLDPDPQVVEVDLVAAETTWQYVPGVDTVVWAYNGSIPGPTIRADVGQTVRVNFRNDLPEETTVHWHGIEVPADVDGSHISQRPIQPGQSYTYEFEVLHGGFFWYHPHVRPFDQVEKGLYGGVVLTDRKLEHRLGLDRLEEHLVFFDDILLDAAMQVVPAFGFADPLQNALYHVNGREGNHLLINGREASGVTLTVPNGEPQRWRIINVANTTFCRLDLNDPVLGFGTTLWEVGSDGGLLERPFARTAVTSPFEPGVDRGGAAGPSVAGSGTQTAGGGGKHSAQAQIPHMFQGVILFPAERMDLVFTPGGTDRTRYTVFQHDWFRGRHSAAFGPGGKIVLGDDPGDGLAPKLPLFDVVVQGDVPPDFEPYEPPPRLRKLPPLPGPPTAPIPVVFGHGDPDPDSGAVTLFAQAQMAGGVMTPLPAPKIDSFNAPDAEVGEVREWVITNLTHGDHNFHTHGFFFELVSYEWQDDLDPTLNQSFTPTERRIKDTVRVPARLGQKGSSRTITKLRVHFDDTGREGRVAAQGMLPTFEPDGSWTSGGWLFHCHVLEHSAKGMLATLEIHEPDESFKLLGKQTPGTGGVYPSLSAHGQLGLGEDVTLELIDAQPGEMLWLVVGDKAGLRAVPGGTLVPSTAAANASNPFFGVFTAVSDGSGSFQWTLPWQSLPSGTTVYVQVAARDAGASEGLSLSNALEFTVP